VIGVPDERMGEELMAWIVLRDGTSATADEIQHFCRAQVAHFKVPRYVRFTDEFPMTVTGKIQKFRMREIAIAELGLATAAATKTA
jgi:fatty-acyl-CoA synthase